ncbi:MAG: hypothetical protein OXG82_18920 [Gammaproteobacteria bacterium]|nr:hypothetical protein [Gammaproteobacteria bacterium]
MAQSGTIATIRPKLLAELRRRPWWMNVLWAFCLYMTFIYMPFDLFFKPVAEDEEVWFGFVLTGWAAKATEPLHWLIYGAGAYGFWKMSRWMWPWAGVYAAQVMVAMLVWNLVDPRGGGWIPGLIAATVFAVPTAALWLAKGHFRPAISQPS